MQSGRKNILEEGSGRNNILEELLEENFWKNILEKDSEMILEGITF